MGLCLLNKQYNLLDNFQTEQKTNYLFLKINTLIKVTKDPNYSRTLQITKQSNFSNKKFFKKILSDIIIKDL